MPEAELLIEDKLISQLTTGMSQWTLREDNMKRPPRKNVKTWIYRVNCRCL